MRKPLAVASNLENRYSETNLIFSPDEKSILTGLPPTKAGEKGCIVFLNGETLEEERRVAVGEGAVVRVLWHSRINQVSFGFRWSDIERKGYCAGEKRKVGEIVEGQDVK